MIAKQIDTFEPNESSSFSSLGLNNAFESAPTNHGRWPVDPASAQSCAEQLAERAEHIPVIRPGLWQAEYPFEPHYLALGGGRCVHYVDQGQGPAVVMVHGNPGWSFMWRHLLSSLTGYRRLAVDLLGMGLSSRPQPGPWLTLAGRIADFTHWLDQVVPKGPVHLMAHDWGGPIALGWGTKNPDRVASLTLMNTALRLPSGTSLSWKLKLFQQSRFLGRFLAVSLNLFCGGLVRYGTVRPMTKSAREGFLAPYRLAAHRQAVGGFVQDIALTPKHPSWETLSEIDRSLRLVAGKPSQLIWGLKDFVFTKAFMLDLAARLPGAEIWPLPMAGHCLTEDQPDRIVAICRDFLRRNC
ncbi:MAG: alpha/beta fold hydrolase [Deltaproteobacteria bacterium]|jgi:haloalkane dehalogenase|nr:alpha/beta fold hydrolase [Deltaproteobacteria bacterium]